jgi:hypothetical protein
MVGHVVEVHGEGRPVPIFGGLVVHDHVVDFDVSQLLDAVGNPAKERGHFSLSCSLRVGLGEVVRGVGDPLGQALAFL